MTTVSLKGVEFFAYHGYYPEEQVLGGRFVIDVDISFTPDANAGKDELDGTVNYEHVYEVCCLEMKKPRKLIETVANSIVGRLKSNYAFAESIVLTINKLHPPFKGDVQCAAVTIAYIRP